ncbi:nuclear GTPase SLIP-GC isoform X4 [Dipodomys merriami]|uniref:nuclear GTPase SLIP-GC isoform X4 n=1 Tax=Dipodomys merriami TaxID=94247 RepID=UPI00384E6D7E
MGCEEGWLQWVRAGVHEEELAEMEVLVDLEQSSVDDDLCKEPMKKRRRSDRDQRLRAFPTMEQSALKEYEKLESRTRRVLSNAYQKLIQSVFLDDSIPNGVKYLINRLLALIEKPSLDPIYIGLLGSTGAGKSSLINAIIQKAMFLPVSGESICTSCIVQVSSGCCEQYEAKIHLLSDQEWKEELKNLTQLLHMAEDADGEEEESWDREEAVEEAVWKLQVVYGAGAEGREYEDLLRVRPQVKIPPSRVILLQAQEAGELSIKLDPYIRAQKRDQRAQSAETQIWPLIKHVEVTLPRSALIPEGVVLVDIPGTGDFNCKRDEMWKKTIDRCSAIWVISDIERVSGARAHEELLNESVRACQRGLCRHVALVVTKTDKLHLPEYLRERKVGNHAILSQQEAILERNETIKLKRNRLLKEKLKRKLPAYLKVLEASDLVYTVSAQEYWQQALLTEEQTEIPKLREFIRKRLLDEKKRMVTKYITEAFGLLLLMEGFNSADNLLRSKGNQGFHQTLKAVCLKNGVYASRTLARIDLNEAITRPIYDHIDPVFGDIFRAGKPTSSALMPLIDAFKHSLQEKMTEIRIRNGWKYDSYKKSFLIQEISAILGGLEGYILRRKRRIYESVTSSVQSDLKPCYEEAAQITGRKACERMKDVIRRGVERQVAEGMFERAQERMQHQFQLLKRGITEKMKGSVATMLTLASSQGDSLCKELADVRSEYKEMERLHRGLREAAENAQLRKAMQDFLLGTPPCKAGAPNRTLTPRV